MRELKAQANGGDLIVISSQADQSFFESILPADIWIGLYQDLNDPNYSESSGGWKWVDGTPLTYANWAVGEPSGGTVENHARFVNFGGMILILIHKSHLQWLFIKVLANSLTVSL